MDIVDEITSLKALLDQGAITEAEFNSLKANIISNPKEKLVVQDSSNNGKVRKSSTSRKYLIALGIAIIFIVSLLGVSRLDISKDIIKGVTSRFEDRNEREDGYLYEDGEKIGKIVKVELSGIYPHSYGGVTELEVPEGKMWTPLYYEQISGEKDVCFLEVFYKLRIGYSYNDFYRFEVDKRNFVSGKFSKQNNKAFVKNDKVAVHIISYSSTNTKFIFYCLEEDID